MRTHTKTFHIRFTEKEYDRLCRYAAKAGLPKTTYIRHMINGCEPVEKPDDRFYDSMRQLHGIGNNLNQITHKAHFLGTIDKQQLEQALEEFHRFYVEFFNRHMLMEDLDISAALERGRQLAEAEPGKKGEFHEE